MHPEKSADVRFLVFAKEDNPTLFKETQPEKNTDVTTDERKADAPIVSKAVHPEKSADVRFWVS